MSTLSDFFGGNNKIGINGSGKQVYYAMCSSNTSGGFVYFDENFRLVSVQGSDGTYDIAAPVPHNINVGAQAQQIVAQVFYGVTSTATSTAANATINYMSATNSCGEFGNSEISVYSDGTYDTKYHMSNSQYNKHYLNSYAINSDNLNKRNGYILNNGAINCIDKLNANYNYPKLNTSAYTVSSLHTSMQGSASYNRTRKEMVILSYASTGGNYNVITFQNLDLDLYENPSVAFTRPEVVRVNSTVALTTNWAVSNNESFYNLKPVLSDNGNVHVVVFFSANSQKIYKFTRSGTGAITATNPATQACTTSYGLDQGFQYGQRQITSKDGTTVAIFCPYYYYGTGIECYMINKTSDSYFNFGNTNSGDGIQVLPYKDNGWVFIYAGNGYASNYTGNYIAATYLKDSGGSFTQVGTTKVFPAHTLPNTTNYPGFTQVIDYNLLSTNIRGFK